MLEATSQYEYELRKRNPERKDISRKLIYLKIEFIYLYRNCSTFKIDHTDHLRLLQFPIKISKIYVLKEKEKIYVSLFSSTELFEILTNYNFNSDILLQVILGVNCGLFSGSATHWTSVETVFSIQDRGRHLISSRWFFKFLPAPFNMKFTKITKPLLAFWI